MFPHWLKSKTGHREFHALRNVRNVTDRLFRTDARQNVTSSSTVNAALEGARDNKAPIILQLSQGGSAFFGGKGLDNADQKASIAGAIAAAHYIRAIAPAYGM